MQLKSILNRVARHRSFVYGEPRWVEDAPRLTIEDLQSVRAYLHREDFQRFWEYRSPAWAGKFLDEWCGRVMRSRLEPMKKVARSLRKHRPLLLNWFRAKGRAIAP